MSLVTSIATGASLKVVLDATMQRVLADSGVLADPVKRDLKTTFTNGTGRGKAQVIYHSKFTLATLGSKVLDLTALTSTDDAALGTYALSKIKAIFVVNEAVTTAYNLEIGAAAATQFVGPVKTADDIAVIGPESRGLWENWFDGWTVDATHKLLKFYNPAGGNLPFQVIIIGEGTAS